MTAIYHRAVHATWHGQPRFGRFWARWSRYLKLFAEGVADGLDMAQQARKRHPFVDW